MGHRKVFSIPSISQVMLHVTIHIGELLGFPQKPVSTEDRMGVQEHEGSLGRVTEVVKST